MERGIFLSLLTTFHELEEEVHGTSLVSCQYFQIHAAIKVNVSIMYVIHGNISLYNIVLMRTYHFNYIYITLFKEDTHEYDEVNYCALNIL